MTNEQVSKMSLRKSGRTILKAFTVAVVFIFISNSLAVAQSINLSVDVNEDPVGGKSMLLGSIEYIYPLFERVRISAFSDSGNVWRGLGDIDPTDLNTTVGVGLQIDLPIGPIRLDYGYPIITQQDHLDDASGRLHFNLGYRF